MIRYCWWYHSEEIHPHVWPSRLVDGVVIITSRRKSSQINRISSLMMWLKAQDTHFMSWVTSYRTTLACEWSRFVF
jgi:hypothetical protein